MNSMKRQKDMTLKDESPRLVGVQYATGEDWRNRIKRLAKVDMTPSCGCMCLVVKVKSGAVKNNIA